MLTTQPNKLFYFQHVSLFGCVLSIWSMSVVKLMKLFSICSALSSLGHRSKYEQ